MTATPAPNFPTVGDTILGRYRLERVIARGGMGMVYLGQQISMDREVAVKMVLPQNMENEQTLARFEREVHLAKQLRHPNVVELYDFGRTEHGVLYLVMELLSGEDLKQVIRDHGPMAVGRCGHIALQVLDALSVAHQRGIVHRDLKPSNVFITRMGRHKDFVKLLDFGVAKSLGQEENEDLTQQGQVCGTSAYMAPEMFVTGSVDLTVDIYAMGLILLEMLIGQKVFQGATTAENMILHIQHGITLPSPLKMTPLAKVISRATARRANERYRTASEMLDDLEEALERTPDELKLDREAAASAVAVVPSEDDVLEKLLGDAPAKTLHTQTADSSDLLIIEQESGKKFSPPPLPKALGERTELLDASDSAVQLVDDAAEPEEDDDAAYVEISASDVAVPTVKVDDTPALGAESTEPESDRSAEAVAEGPRSRDELGDSSSVLRTIKQPAWNEQVERRETPTKRRRSQLPAAARRPDPAGDDAKGADFDEGPTALIQTGEHAVSTPDKDAPVTSTQPMRQADAIHSAETPPGIGRDIDGSTDTIAPVGTADSTDTGIETMSSGLSRAWIPLVGIVACLAVVVVALAVSYGSDDTVDPEIAAKTEEQRQPIAAKPPEPAPVEPDEAPPTGEDVDAVAEVEAEPQPVRWNIRLVTEPPGATILDGDQELGTTPTTMSLGEGAIPERVKLELDGYEPMDVAIDVEPGGGDVEIERELARKPEPKPVSSGRTKPSSGLESLEIGKFD